MRSVDDCSRNGCQSIRCPHIVLNKYYCRKCFAEFLASKTDVTMSRRKWMDEFELFAKTPVHDSYLDAVVPGHLFEAHTLACRFIKTS